MLTAALVLLFLAALICLLFGARYFFARQFMPYHAVVAGRPWDQLDGGVRTVILGMLKIIGGGFAAYGIALIWFLLPLSVGQSWAPWAVLTTSLAAVLPSVYVTTALKRLSPSAPVPVVPAVVVLALTLAGAALAFAA